MVIIIIVANTTNNDQLLTSGVLEHKWQASLKTILFLYE